MEYKRDLNRLRETDLFGRFFFRTSNHIKFSGYYAALKAVRPLITSEDWIKNITGYYLNVADDEFDSVRLSYFTSDPGPIKGIIENFLSGRDIEHKLPPEKPRSENFSNNYGGQEIQFRRYLTAYTQIGLDIMEANLINARCLFATFRWQVMIARKPFKPHFIRTFEAQSQFYNSFSDSEKDQFWKDFSFWPNPNQVDWAHMFVNMVLGADWPISQFIEPRVPLPIWEINDKTRIMGFKISHNWHP